MRHHTKIDYTIPHYSYETNYAIQCTDQISGQVGDFIFDVQKYKEAGKYYAIGPVYPDLYAFYKHTNSEEIYFRFIQVKN